MQQMQPGQMQGQPMMMQPGQMQPQVIMMQAPVGPYQEAEVKCCCCFPMRCAIVCLFLFGLLKLVPVYLALTLGTWLKSTGIRGIETWGLILIVFNVVAFLPMVYYYFTCVWYIIKDDTIETRAQVIKGFNAYLISNALFLIGWPVILVVAVGPIGFGASLPIIVQELINISLLFWWRVSAINYYHEKVKEANNGVIPPNLKK